MSAEFISFIGIPLLIFVARVFDQTLGALRILFISKGNKLFAPLVSFFEALIWILVIAQVLQNLGNAFAYIAYALGFATGNYMGILVEEKLAMGINMIRVITRSNSQKIQRKLREAGYGFVNLIGEDIDGGENVLLIIVNRKEVSKVVALVREVHPHAFFSVEEVQSVSDIGYPLKVSGVRKKKNKVSHTPFVVGDVMGNMRKFFVRK